MPKRKPAKRKKKYFVLLKGNKDTNHIYCAARPRDAALKAARRGVKNIRLRERGTDRVHVFEGTREKVNAPEKRPEWMPPKIWVANVKKIGVEHLKKK